MLWILLTAAAAPLQVARNSLQRGLMGDAGPWGATLVRFLFGLPFALMILGVATALTPEAAPHFSWRFVIAVSVGALLQVGGTGAFLVAMRRAGFAVATMTQQSSLLLAAVIGWAAFGDHLSGMAALGIALTTAGMALLSWPRADQVRGVGLGIALGLLAGAAFAVSLNGYRQASLALEPQFPIYSGVASVCVAQALQSVVLIVALAIYRPGALAVVVRSWRPSLGAGVFGAAASSCWFAALALAPSAGAVRAIGVIEAPIAAAAGRTLFKERLTTRQIVAGVLAAVGVVMTALG